MLTFEGKAIIRVALPFCKSSTRSLLPQSRQILLRDPGLWAALILSEIAISPLKSKAADYLHDNRSKTTYCHTPWRSCKL
jgi:hypothetical protein